MRSLVKPIKFENGLSKMERELLSREHLKLLSGEVDAPRSLTMPHRQIVCPNYQRQCENIPTFKTRE
jgi:hypothetical protein